MRPLPCQEYLKECFDYDSETGVLTWKDRPASHFSTSHTHKRWRARFAGTAAGNLRQGRNVVRINSMQYLSSRVIWVWVTGETPPNLVDHKNTDRADDRWCNLRAATHSQNNYNRGKIRNTTGLKGACFHKRTGRFTAAVTVDGKRRYIGVFDTAEEAHEAYCAAAKKLHGKFFNPGVL